MSGAARFPRKVLPVAVVLFVLAAMPVVFRNSVGALASSAGLRRLGETVVLLDSLRAAGQDGCPPMVLLRAGAAGIPTGTP